MRFSLSPRLCVRVYPPWRASPRPSIWGLAPVAISSCVVLLAGATAWSASATVEVIGTYYRPDQAFPQFDAFWNEGAVQPDEEAAGDQADYVQPANPESAAPRPADAGQAVPARGTAEARNAPARGRAGSPKLKTEPTPAQANTKPDAPKPTQVAMPLGGSLHLFLRNGGKSTASVQDALVGGLSLNESLAFSDQRKVRKFASIYFAKLAPAKLQSLIDNGEPVWWKADPVEIAPGATAELIIRLRSQPKSAAVPVGVRLGSRTVTADVPIADPAPRLEGICFGRTGGQAASGTGAHTGGQAASGTAPDLKEVYLYLRHPAGAAPTKITLDGKDITSSCRISHDPAVPVTPVVARLAQPLKAASFHVFGATYADKSSVMSGLRAWSDEFVYGVFGGKPGNANELEVGRQYIDDLTAHNLNLQMPQIGSAACQNFFKDPKGQEYMASKGFRFVLSDPGKFGIRDPYALYVHDEPDCGDYRAEGLPSDNKKVGVLAQWCISHANEFRKAAPDVMQMLNLNMTYKPHNWHVYGQIPDIFTVDPYYQVRLKDVYYDHPERRPLYEKATYIYMVSSLAQSAGAPNPVHVILYGNQQKGKQGSNKVFRFPTPPEKRIEVYYALAGGAKGLSYWWYTPGAPAYGLGAATLPQPDPAARALWREIGLIGAEVRTAGEVLVRSCPVEVPIEASPNVWVRSLAAGDDTLVVLVVNDQYRNTDKGTEIKPVRNASVTVTLPEWIERPQVFEITPAGTRPMAARAARSELKLPLGTVDVTRMIVITSDQTLRSRLQDDYSDKLAANTAKLLK